MHTTDDAPDAASSGRSDSKDSTSRPRVRTARTGVADEVAHLAADIEDLVKQATSLSDDELSAAKARLAERLAAARASMAQVGDTIATHARTTAAATDEYVREQPWRAIGIGAVVGLLLGFALARR
jgi:ElaB/YqjD/DUF883 family membrane-anchored ribosome-binding protein